MTSLVSPGFRSVGFRDIGAAAGAPQPVPGAIAYYPCDEGSGQILHDYSGNGNHGILGSTAGVDTNDPTWNEKGLVFEGDDFVTIKLPPNITSGTVMIMVNQSDWADFRYILDSRTSSGGTYGLIYTQITTGQIISSNNAASTYLNQTAFTPQTAAALGTVTLPLDQWNIITSCGLNFTQSAGNISIGKKNYGSLANTFIGGIAGMLVYPIILSPPQVAQNYAYEKWRLALKGAILP